MNDKEIDLEREFPDMRFIESPPALGTFFGIGCCFYGTRDHDDETCSYVTNHCFCVLFIPVLILGAYRIVRTTQGLCILGREPLSGGAKLWNGIVPLGIVMAITFTGWYAAVNSREYIARKNLSEAARLADEGQFREATKLYCQVAGSETKHVPAAVDKLRLLFDEAAQREPLPVLAEGLAVAAEAARWNRRVAEALNPFEYGMQLVEPHLQSNPRGALAVLDAVTPLAVDRERLLVIRREVLESLVRAAPEDTAGASELALVYEEQGELERCEPLLAPRLARLGTTEGARILGQIYARQGKFEEGRALLASYANERLKRLPGVQEAYEAALEAAQQSAIGKLETGDVSASFKRRYQDASDNERLEMVNNFVQEALKNDPGVAQAQEAMLEVARVVPVALDLGMVMLRQARSMQDPGARQAELEAAEKTFLSVRGFAEGSDQYRVTLGEVYYWLGKQKEGRALFDAFLKEKGRTHESLMAVGALLRDLGSISECRPLLEEAYEVAQGEPEKHAAACLRAITATDLDDSTAWLRRASQADPEVKALLNTNLGKQAVENGDDEGAAGYFREAIRLYEKQVESPATMNNAALVHFSLFAATGDTSVLDKGTALVERAAQLDPSAGITAVNAAHAVLEASLREIIGDAIDFRKLRQRADLDLLSFLYEDSSGRERYTERVSAHAGVQKAKSFLGGAMVVAPKRGDAYSICASIHEFLRDGDELRELLQRVSDAQPDLGDREEEARAFRAGEKDQEMRKGLQHGIAQLQRVVEGYAPEDRDRTFAVAACKLSRALVGAAMAGTEVDADLVVRRVEEAHAAAPSRATLSRLIAVLCFRASRHLAEREPRYAELVREGQREIGQSYLLAWAMSRDEKLRQAALGDEDLKRVLDLLQEGVTRFPEEQGAWSWAMLRHSRPTVARALAQRIQENEIMQLMRRIHQRTSAASLVNDLLALWEAQLAGKEAEAEKLLQRCLQKGTLVLRKEGE